MTNAKQGVGLDLLSLVIPVYNEEEVLPALLDRLDAVCAKLDVECEWVFVNDGSRDQTAALLSERRLTDSRIVIVDLSRNFGHAIALTAGLDHARGDAVVVLDADLQDPPELITELVARHREGFDVVRARRRSRRDTIFKRMTAWLYYRLLRWSTGVDVPANVGEFCLMSREVVDALSTLRERHRLMRGLVAWVGFTQTIVEFDREARTAGETKYPLRRMFALALDGLTSFSVVPLRLVALLGFMAIVGGLVYASYAVYVGWYLGLGVPGWTSLAVLQILLNGAILVALGVIGEYVGRIFEESKARPLYIVRGRVSDLEPSKRAGSPAGDGPRPAAGA